MSTPTRSSAIAQINAALPHLADDRGLLTQVKSGRGRGLKELRQYIQSHPELLKSHTNALNQLEQNDKQKQKMMWEKDSKSMCKRVDTNYRRKAEVTSVIAHDGRAVPDPKLVKAGQQQVSKKAEEMRMGLRHVEGTSLLMPNC